MRSMLQTILSIMLGLFSCIVVGIVAAISPSPIEASVQWSVSGDDSIMYVENVDQFEAGARFQVLGGPDTLWLTNDAIWITHFDIARPPAPELLGFSQADPYPVTPRPRAGSHVKLSFANANRAARIEPFDRLATKVSYFQSSDPEKWRPDVPVWRGVRYVDLYPGVDLELFGEGGQWRWQLTAGGSKSDLSQVRLRVEGVQNLRRGFNALSAITASGQMEIPLLEVEESGVLDVADTSISRLGTATFEIAPLEFQPVHDISSSESTVSDALTYSTFLGSGGRDRGQAVAVDSSGAAYIAGRTDSPDFPTTPGAFDDSLNGNTDAFVAKLTPSGDSLSYLTFLGGADDEWGQGIVVDENGESYVTGCTYSSDFPSTPGAFDTTHNGSSDAYIAKLNASGSALIYATLLGHGSSDWVQSIAVDGSGAAYITGRTDSPEFPTTWGAFDRTLSGDRDAFVAKVNPSGSALHFSTFVGGAGDEWGQGIAVDATGAAYIAGTTESADFPSTPGAFDGSYSGSSDAFIAKLNGSGSALTYATLLGDKSSDWVQSIDVDGSGAAYITGRTDSADFPTTPGAFDGTIGGTTDAFVTKVNTSGSALSFSTFLGGTDSDFGYGVVVDGSGTVHVTGWSNSSDFPTTTGAYDVSHNGSSDAFLVSLDSSGSTLTYATLLGGKDIDAGNSIVVDGSGVVYVLVWTDSSNFPSTEGAFDTSHNGGYDAALVKIATSSGVPTSAISGAVTGDSACTSDVTISAGPGYNTTTDSGGHYVLSGLPTGTYTVTPSKSGCIFTSVASQPVSVPPDVSSVDFTASTGSAYSISGTVTGDSACTSDVTISAGSGYNTTTDSSGHYVLSGLPTGTYTVTPSKSQCAFTPESSQPISIPPGATVPEFVGGIISGDGRTFLPSVEG